MITKKHYNYFIVATLSMFLLVWTLYSFLFYQSYNEAKVFATEGAQSVVQILEILNYRGEEFKIYFISFFILTSLSFIYLNYLFLFVKKNELEIYSLIVVNLVVLIFIVINIINKFFIFLLILIGMALLIILAITLTVNYLYMEKIIYEDGDVIKIEGPFKDGNEARFYAEKELINLKKDVNLENFYLYYVIYSDDSKKFYADFYIEEIKIDRKDDAINEE